MSPASPAQRQRHEAAQRLALPRGEKPADHLARYKKFLQTEEHGLRLWHRRGAGGRELARARTQLIDLLLENLFDAAHQACPRTNDEPVPAFALVAIGGFGRGELSPCSDVDLMFLHELSPRAMAEHPYVKFVVEQLLYALWDLGLKVGHSTRSTDEAVAQAQRDMQSKTALIESRLVLGDDVLYEQFRHLLVRKCVRGQEADYIDQRMHDQVVRHQQYGDSVFLQEPNVKSGCGGLRDYQNLLWMAFFKYGTLSLPELRRLKFLAAPEQRELTEAYDFVLRVRHALHYLTNRPHEAISLNLQPQVAGLLGYRQHDLLRRIESFMRDYYRHTRIVFLLTNALTERMALRPPRFQRLGALLGRGSRPRTLDGFVIRNGLIEAGSPQVFRAQPARLLRVFRHAQQHGVELSPALRTQIRHHLKLIDRAFRQATEPRDIFLAILQHKGQVGHLLRIMHETEVLGAYLPEFGQLTCLVQHEFFHRYTADEHT
ncbi:[protein-PII] uridylyltransferase, partial [bacterium]|nr:[protein-PII] uridylyltransferase [bacterium]